MAIGINKNYTEDMKSDIDENLDTISEVLEDVEEIDRHNHHFEKWFETAASASGELHVADRIGSGGGAFQIDAGNDTWGAWAQILGSGDTPTELQKTKFDFHELQITAAERTALYYIQIAFGETGDSALANNRYTETPFEPQSVAGKPDYIEIRSEQINVKEKVWARCKCPGQNTATLNLLFGIHEYLE